MIEKLKRLDTIFNKYVWESDEYDHFCIFKVDYKEIKELLELLIEELGESR